MQIKHPNFETNCNQLSPLCWSGIGKLANACVRPWSFANSGSPSHNSSRYGCRLPCRWPAWVVRRWEKSPAFLTSLRFYPSKTVWWPWRSTRKIQSASWSSHLRTRLARKWKRWRLGTRGWAEWMLSSSPPRTNPPRSQISTCPSSWPWGISWTGGRLCRRWRRRESSAFESKSCSHSGCRSCGRVARWCRQHWRWPRAWFLPRNQPAHPSSSWLGRR